MAAKTNKNLRNQVMYQVFVRNFSEEGTFAAVEKRLDEIKALGTNIIWLMPIHPIGVLNRKGTLGSPYAISDYRAVNPEFGTLDDFKQLVSAIHDKGMKCIIDVVYNHTSPDSVLSKSHPEWFFHRPDGSFGNRVGDWTDIIDLDYNQPDLWDYQIETLCRWAEIVDGFRCDVAPLIPIAFWEKARDAVERVRPGAVWLSESVEPEFILHMRSRGLTALSDAEIYRAFDLSYDYDCYGKFTGYLCGDNTLADYAEAINRQEYIYPDNYVKLRFLENHDQPRAGFLIPDVCALRNWTAFSFFQKGLTLIYNGQECGVSHLPDLFDKDTVDWCGEDNVDFSQLLTTLAVIKRDALFADSTYHVQAQGQDFLVAVHEKDDRKALGVFAVTGKTGLVSVDFSDGMYTNLIDNKPIEVFRGRVAVKGEPIIIIR